MSANFKTVFKPLLFLLISALIFSSTGCSEKTLTEDEYLIKNAKILNLDDTSDNSEFDVLKNSIKDKKIIFTNEEHGAKENFKLREKMTNYLIDNWDLKYIVTEGGFAEGYIFNEYLRTGDESIIDFYKGNEMFSNMNTDSFFDYMRALYKKNQLLSEDKKITFLGTDCMESSNSIAQFINIIEDKHDNLSVNQIRTLDDFRKNISNANIANLNSRIPVEKNRKSILKIVSEIETSINDDRRSYENNLDDDLYGIEFVLNNIKSSQDFAGLTDDTSNGKEYYETRDKHTYDNFKNLKDKYNIDKCYMHFGIGHAYQKEFNDIKFLASYLNDDEEFNGKTYTISTLYNVGNAVNYSNFGVRTLSTISLDLMTLLKESEYNDKHLLIPLDKKSSPFEKAISSKVFETNSINDDTFVENKGVTTDYMQSIIIINHPNAVEDNAINKFKSLMKK